MNKQQTTLLLALTLVSHLAAGNVIKDGFKKAKQTADAAGREVGKATKKPVKKVDQAADDATKKSEK